MSKPSTRDRQFDALQTLLRDQGWTAGDIDLDEVQRLLVERNPRLFAGGLNREQLTGLLTLADTMTVFERYATVPALGSPVSLVDLAEGLRARFPEKYPNLTVAELGQRLRLARVRVGTVRIPGRGTAKGTRSEWLDQARDPRRRGSNL